MKNNIILILTASVFALSMSARGNNTICKGDGMKKESMKKYAVNTEIANIDGLQFWFDASSLNLNDGDLVSSWNNLATPTLTGVGTSATQSNDPNKAEFLSNGTIGNDLPTLQFNEKTFFRFGAGSGFNMADLTLFAVIKTTKVEGYHEFLSRLSPPPYDHNWFFNIEGGFNFGWGCNNGASTSYYQVKPHIDENIPYVLTGRRQGDNGYSYINGWLESSFKGPVADDNLSPFYIGDGGGGSSFLGEVGEIIGFNKSLSEEDLNKVFNYLQNKWGIHNDTAAFLKNISVKGETIQGFSPKKFNYSIMTQETIKDSDITFEKYNSSDTAVLRKEGKNIYIDVSSGTSNRKKTYSIRTSRMEHDFNEIKDLSLNEVTITKGFWKDLLDQYQDYTINYIFDMYDFTESFDNFDRVANGERLALNNTSAHAGEILIPGGNNASIGDKRGTFYYGQEPWREGLIYECISAAGNFISSYGHKEDKVESIMRLKQRMDGYIERIYRAALTTTGKDKKGNVIDGYFSTYNLLKSSSIFDEASGGAIYNHDLYNYGALLEAATNYYKATGDTKLLYVAIRFTEFIIDYIYGYGSKPGYMVVPPHSLGEETLLDFYDLLVNNPSLVKEIEEKYSYPTGLSSKDRYKKLKIRLDKYRELIDAWVEERGHYDGRYGKTSYGTYAQDQCSYEDMHEALGHAVRANLFYSSVAAIGNYTENYSYVKAMKGIWDNIVDTQLYITGGTGASQALGEAYAGSYVLPQDGYCETCASAGMAYFADNMFEIFGDAEYPDVLELELYNGILGSLSMDGNAFYYCNPLVSEFYQRPLWSGATPCCPPMYMKVMSFLPQYIYAKSSDAVYVNQYISSTADFDLTRDVIIKQYSDLPTGNKAYFKVTGDETFKLKLRMPSWASGYEVKMNGRVANVAVGDDGYITLSKNWTGETDVEITFAKEVLRLYQHNVSYNDGQTAIKYGPFIYCAETTDNKVMGSDMLAREIVIGPDGEFTEQVDETTFKIRITNDSYRNHKIIFLSIPARGYRNAEAFREFNLKLIPFYLRNNRENGRMQVWIKEE